MKRPLFYFVNTYPVENLCKTMGISVGKSAENHNLM